MSAIPRRTLRVDRDYCAALVNFRGYSRLVATFEFHIVPNAKIDRVVGEFAAATPSRGGHGTAIKIKLRAPAVEGKANAALRSFLAQKLKISGRAIVLERGQKSREKLVRIDGVDPEAVRRNLLELKG